MITTGGLVNYNQKFIDTAEHFDTFIMNRARKHPILWFDRIPKGTLSDWDGLVRKSNIFHGGLGEQAGLSNWSPIQVSRKPSGNDAGFDACAYDPTTFTYAWESVQYTGARASWQSEPICINDIRYVEQGREQCRLITSFMAYITQSVWENWNRENYVKMAVDGGNAFILTDGGLDYADTPTVRFTYDPYAVDANGDSYITFPATLQVSTLNWSFFDWWQDYLGDQCPEASIANSSGLPVFGMILHKRDFNKMIMEDTVLREDMRYAKPMVLIDDYRSFQEWKGWAIIHDQRQMRFKVKSLTATTVTAVRVKPLKNGRAVTIGNIPTVDPDYNNAELAIGVIFMNEVLQNLIPTPIANPGGGMIFGAQPKYNGTFTWINEYDRELNPLKEVGYFFARFEAFPKPLMYSNEAIVFLYRRCPQTWGTDCNTAFDDVATAVTDEISLAADLAAGDLDATNYTMTVTLAQALYGLEVGDAILVDDDDGDGEIVGTIIDGSMAPTYVLGFTAAQYATLEVYGKYTAAGAAIVTA